MCLPEALLPELGQAEMLARVAARKAVFKSLYPSLENHAVHPATAAYEAMGAPMEAVPLPLHYAYALVNSRCFVTSDEDTFAFVPFVDMCQHSANPSANFASDATGFRLLATRDLQPGEEVTISYGADYTSDRMFEQYGFVEGDGAAADAALLRELVALACADGDAETLRAIEEAPSKPLADSVVGMQALVAAFGAVAESPHASAPRVTAVLEALASEDPEAKVVAPAALRAALRWRGEPSSATERPERDDVDGLRDDLDALLAEQAEVPAGGGDPRTAAVRGYRIGRLRQMVLADEVLSAFLGR